MRIKYLIYSVLSGLMGLSALAYFIYMVYDEVERWTITQPENVAVYFNYGIELYIANLVFLIVLFVYVIVISVYNSIKYYKQYKGV